MGNADGHGVTLNAGNILLNNNYIGLALSGSALGNSGDGVFVATTSSGNQIGSNPEAAILSSATLAATGVISNVISANGGNGISFHASADNIVVSNRIGTSTDGNTALGQRCQWHLADRRVERQHDRRDASSATICRMTGTTRPATRARNDRRRRCRRWATRYRENAANGILIDASSENNFLNGNLVGTTASGNWHWATRATAWPSSAPTATHCIGCTVVDEPFVYYNVVGGNGGNGIRVTDFDNVTIRANFVGLGANNDTLVGNALDGVLINGSSFNTQVGGVIPLGNVISGNTAERHRSCRHGERLQHLEHLRRDHRLLRHGPQRQQRHPDHVDRRQPDGPDQRHLGQCLNNGLEISGDAWGVSVVPNIIGLDTRGDVEPGKALPTATTAS